MITADLVHDLLALSGCPPFDRLTEAELMLVAGHIRRRSYAPGGVLLAGGSVAERLVAVCQGEVTIDGQAAPAVFDAGSALFGLPTRADYVAGSTGAEVLLLAKPHLFTLARECPDFIVGLAEIEARAKQ